MNRSNYPQYNEAVTFYLNDNMDAVQQILLKSDLSQAEKKLLKARILFKKKDFQSACDLLLTIQTDCPFLKADRDLFTSSSYSYLSQWEKAMLYNMHALENFQVCMDRKGLFLANYNLSVDYSRMAMLEMSYYHINKASSYAEGSNERVLIYRAMANHFSKMNQYNKACEILDHAFADQDALYPRDLNNLKVLAADIYFRAGELRKSFIYLEELFNNNQIYERVRVHFQYRLLKALIEETPLKAPSDIISSSGEYLLKWNILKAIENGDLKIAAILWNQLIELFPKLFAENFNVLSESENHSIFARYLDHALNRHKNMTVTNNPFRPDSKLYLLFEKLTRTSSPIRKEDLIEKIWQTSYSPELDTRFYKLIERFKKSTQLNLINQGHSYFIKS